MSDKYCNHKFKPRYDRKWSTPLKDLLDCRAATNCEGIRSNPTYLQSELYVYDICVKCGKKIGRE